MAKPAVMRTWTNGTVVDSTMLNSDIRDAINEIWKGTTNGDLDFYASATTKTRLPIGSTGNVLTVVGGVPAWQGYVGCSVIQGNSFTAVANNTVTEVSGFTTEYVDTNIFHDGSNNYITIPANFGGLYLIGAGGYWDGNNTTLKLRQIGIKIGTTVIHQNSTVNPDGDTLWQEVNTLQVLNAGDTVKLVLLQKSGIALNFNNGKLWVMKVK